MSSWHAKSSCCRAKIYQFGSRRRQCSHCKRTWRIRRKRRGRKPSRSRPGVLQEIFLKGRTLKSLAPRYSLTPQGLSRRFRRTLYRFVSRPRLLRLPTGPLVLVFDGLYFRFRGQHWVLYLMAVKPCRRNRALFLDPVLLPGRENVQCWSQVFTTIPTAIYKRICASVSDDIRGIIGLATRCGWIVQLCHFHLISQLQGSRGGRKRKLVGRPVRETLYRLTRQALEVPDGPRLESVLKRLKELVQKPMGSRVMRMVVREFLRRADQFRAYRKYPELNLPTTTGSVEAMGRKVRDLMRQTRSIRSPQALQLWATALIRMRSTVTCNGKHFQPNFVV
jgi:hypothetical protein